MPQVEVGLEPHPELRRRVERLGEEDGCLRGDPPLAVDIVFTRWIGTPIRDPSSTCVTPRVLRKTRPSGSPSALTGTGSAVIPRRDDAVVAAGAVEAIEVILAAIDKAGSAAGKDMVLALDPAASEFFEDGAYVFGKSDKSRKTSVQTPAPPLSSPASLRACCLNREKAVTIGRQLLVSILDLSRMTIARIV